MRRLLNHAAPVVPVLGRLLRARAVGEYLGISEHKARHLIASGDLACVRTARGRLMGVYERDCDEWIERHRRVALPIAATPRLTGDDRIADLLPPPEERIF